MKKSVSGRISSLRSRSARPSLRDLQPVMQVFAELAAQHHRLEIAIGGRPRTST
jgi:hypothetical protein